MSAESKKGLHLKNRVPYSSWGIFPYQLSELPKLKTELLKTVPNIAPFLSKDFIAGAPELADSISSEIQQRVTQLQVLKEDQPVLAQAMEERYLMGISEYVEHIKSDYFMNVSFALGSFIVLVSLADALSSTEAREYYFSNKMTIEAITTLLVISAFAFITFSYKAAKRTLKPQQFITQPIQQLHEKFDKDLQIIAAGRVPPRFPNLEYKLDQRDLSEIEQALSSELLASDSDDLEDDKQSTTVSYL